MGRAHDFKAPVGNSLHLTRRQVLQGAGSLVATGVLRQAKVSAQPKTGMADPPISRVMAELSI